MEVKINVRISTVLAIIALIINAMELILVNFYIMSAGGWGNIPMFGIPWLTSLSLLLVAIALSLIGK